MMTLNTKLKLVRVELKQGSVWPLLFLCCFVQANYWSPMIGLQRVMRSGGYNFIRRRIGVGKMELLTYKDKLGEYTYYLKGNKKVKHGLRRS